MSEFEKKVYEEYKSYIDLISKAEGEDISVSTSMFIANIEKGANYKYINKEATAKRLNEIRTETE